MPVDPHIAALLTMLAETGLPPMYEGTAEAARSQYLTLSAARSPDLVTPVGAVEDTTVPGAERDLRARVYRPEGEGPFPTVAFFHGGGWVIGDLDTHDQSVREICRGARAVVVAVGYRLPPSTPSPLRPRTPSPPPAGSPRTGASSAGTTGWPWPATAPAATSPPSSPSS